MRLPGRDRGRLDAAARPLWNLPLPAQFLPKDVAWPRASTMTGWTAKR
jgi:hypothetical protein